MTQVDSTSDARVVNNAVRHQYKVLSDAEKAQMLAVKDKGREFLELIESLRTPEEVVKGEDGEPMTLGGQPVLVGTYDRELNIAAERIEEAVMWAVKHITA